MMSTGGSRTPSRRRSSIPRVQNRNDTQGWIFLSLFIALVAIIIVLLLVYFLIIRKKSMDNEQKTDGAFDDPVVVKRFATLRDQWNFISNDPQFRALADTLMTVNSNALNPLSGNLSILNAYNDLDQYCKRLTAFRVTLIYTDGIVYYDSSLPIDRVYFMDSGLPKQVSMNTLGSPLKDHNTVPEVTNSIIFYPTKPDDTGLMGLSLANPIYTTLITEGFGFVERRSSSLNVPYSYVAKFMMISVDPNTRFMHGCTLRVSAPISPS